MNPSRKRVREFHCNKSADSFCYVCGKFTAIGERKEITKLVRTLYAAYFENMQIEHQDKCWTSNTCRTTLSKWGRKVEGRHFTFKTPMIWRDPVNHQTNCYICLTIIFGFSSRNKDAIVYAPVNSITLPVPRSNDDPIPVPPANADTIDEDQFEETEDRDTDGEDDPLYIPDTNQPHPLSQGDLNDLVRDLSLTKDMSELLGSRLQQWKFLENGVFITAARRRSDHLAACFGMRNNICHCWDISHLFEVMNQPFEKDEWRLFIDGSKTSIKAVLLHNGNVKPSIPVAFATGMKEEFDVMRDILNFIQYERNQFKIVADFKVIALLMGLQSGYTKYNCFLCLYDSRARNEHWSRETWPERTEYTPGAYNVKSRALVPRENIILPPLHIKLGLMTQFVKAVGKTNEAAIDFLDSMFPRLSRFKVEEGIFVGPQIRRALHSEEFRNLLTVEQEAAWASFEAVIDGFLGNVRDPNYKQLVGRMLENFHTIESNLPLKMHFLKSHIDFFPGNLGDFSDEHGERFHQDISDMEDRFNGRYAPKMLGEYCWSLLRDTRALHKRRGPKKHF